MKIRSEQRNFRIHVSIVFLFVFLVVLASCSSRKHSITSNTNAAKAANAMANLENRDLYKFITDWSGVKYRNGGLDKRGIDCSGFAMLLEKNVFERQLPRRSRDQANFVKSQTSGRLKEGDLIFFSFGGNEVDHVGVYLNDDYFVHASTVRGVVVDNIKLPAYQKAFVKAGSIKK
jgi:probable lipoprotein NlpC